MTIKKVSVYLGSREGCRPIFMQSARQIGAALARNHITVIYGGANIGTMKALADGVTQENGHLVGVIPNEFISRGLAYAPLEKLIPVTDLRERKRIMEQMSEASVILPGGFGTLDEFFDYTVNLQLGFHRKPVFVLNQDGFYEPLIRMVRTMEENGFLEKNRCSRIHYCSSVEEIIRGLKNPVNFEYPDYRIKKI